MNLVTGATGHIGNVLVRHLLARGEAVRAITLPSEDLTPLAGLEVDCRPGDITRLSEVRPAFAGVRTVFHLAGIISILPGRNDLLRRVNVQGTLNVLQAACQAGISRLVFASSIHAIQRAPHGVIIDESLPFDPANPAGEYDRTKAEATLAVLEASQQGLDAVVVCPTGVIGPYDYRCSELGQLILDCADRKPQLYVEGAYDFVDVRDVAQGLILASQRGRPGECYILSGERISVKSLLELIWEISGARFPRLKIPFDLARLAARFSPLYYHLTRTRPRLTPYSLETLASNSNITCEKARRELGYSARSLRDSLVDTIQWLRANRALWQAGSRP
jgi:dihydroflavonol-4-reductase